MSVFRRIGLGVIGVVIVGLLNGQTQTTPIDSLNEQVYRLQFEQPQKARTLARQTFKAARNINDTKGMADAINHIGTSFYLQDDTDSSIVYYLQALWLREQMGDSAKMAQSYNNVGMIYRDLEEYDQAIQYYRKSIRLKRRFGPEKKLAASLMNLAIVYLSVDSVQQGLSLLQESKTRMEAQNDFRLGMVFEHLGTFHFEQNRYDSARYYYRKCLYQYREQEDSIGLKSTYNNLGAVSLEYQNYDSAIYWYQQSLTLDGATYGAEMHLMALRGKTEALMHAGKPDSAQVYLQLLDTLTEQFYRAEKTTIVQELRTQYETEQKEQQINLLEKEQAMKAAQINNLFLLLAGLALLLLVGVVLFLFYRQRQRNRLLLKEQEVNALIREQELRSMNAMLEGQEAERKRIARDLHDRLGGMLSTIKMHFNGIEKMLNRTDEKSEAQYKTTTALLDQAVEEVRRISHNMISGVLLQFGLVTAVKDLAHTIAASKQVKTKVLVLGLDDRLPLQREIICYRILQELLTNALKHANADLITIRLKKLGHQLEVMVKDDGKGFDPDNAVQGIGLQNIRGRVEQLNGNLNLESKIGSGTTLTFTFPIAAQS